jgi:hypothetical protein
LASTVNVTTVAPDGPLLLDADTQPGKPVSVQPLATLVVTVVPAVPPAVRTVAEVDDKDNDGPAAWVTVNETGFKPLAVKVTVPVRAVGDVLD